MKYFNGGLYPETAKSAENENLHILIGDNGAFTVSHKESGRVFFELPTLMLGFDDSFAYCTQASIMKNRDGDMTTFTAVLPIRIPTGRAEPLYAFESTAVVNATVCDGADELLFSIDYEESAFTYILRLPTGIEHPTVNGNEFSEAFKTPFELNSELTLTDESGEIFRIAVAAEKDASVSVTESGDIDVYLPSSEPAERNKRSTFNIAVCFSE